MNKTQVKIQRKLRNQTRPRDKSSKFFFFITRPNPIINYIKETKTGAKRSTKKWWPNSRKHSRGGWRSWRQQSRRPIHRAGWWWRPCRPQRRPSGIPAPGRSAPWSTHSSASSAAPWSCQNAPLPAAHPSSPHTFSNNSRARSLSLFLSEEFRRTSLMHTENERTWVVI